MEWIAMAIVLPLLCLVHLLTSPTAQSPSVQSMAIRKTSLLIHPTELQILPWAVAIGHFVPIALTFYFPMEVTGPIWKSGQFWLIGRLFHPLFTSIAQLVLSIFARGGDSDYSNAARRNRDVLKQLQSVYTFASSIATVLHLGTLSLVICSQVSTSMFTPQYQAAFNPITVWKPFSYWDDSAKTTVASIGTGALYFLQWDVSHP